MDVLPKPAPAHGKLPGRRERKKLDTRQRIFSAAFELFREKGFEATTVEEIAERADVGKGTVFNYFPQKTAFLVAAYQAWAQRIREDLGPVESWTGPAPAQLRRVFGHLTDLAVEHRSLARQVIFEHMRQAHERLTQEEAGEGLESPGESLRHPSEPEPVRALEVMTREVVRRAMEAQEIRGEVEIDQAASLIAATTFHTLVRGLVQAGSAPEIKQAMEGKLDIIFTGLAP